MRTLISVPGNWTLKDTYYFPLGQFPWMRVNDQKQKPPAMRDYQDKIAIMAREQIETGEAYGKLEGDLMVVITYYTPKPKGDQTNNGKCIEDALNRIAYHDDKQNRQVIILEETADTASTKVEIYTKVN